MTTPLYEARRVTKSYGEVDALRGVDFAVHPGEIVALVGDNGAGKSTLVRILSGAEEPDSGELHLDGSHVRFASPYDARAHGIETVYQDLALASDLDLAANLYLGREIRRPGLAGRLGFLDKTTMQHNALKSVDDLGVVLKSSRVPVASLSGGQRQSVAVARAAMWASRVVFMDEPTAALGVVQTRQVQDLIRRVRDRGLAVVLISHNMQQVLEIADRVEVLRLGQRVSRLSTEQATVEQLVAAMTAGEPEEAKS